MPASIAAETREHLLDILAGNWQAEIGNYYTYRTLAEREPDPHRQRALHLLATAEQYHAQLWARRIRDLGEDEPTYKGPDTGKADTL